MTNRKKLKKFLKGENVKFQAPKSESNEVIVIEATKEGFAVVGTVEMPLDEIDDYIKNNYSKNSLVLDFARPITREQVEAMQNQ